MTESIEKCKCGFQNVEAPNKCHCIMLNSAIVANNRNVLEKRYIRYHCCVCTKHPIIKKAIKANKKGKNFDKKELILFLIKQFDWYMIWNYNRVDALAVTTANATDEIIDDQKIYCERCLFHTLESSSPLRFGKDNEDFRFALILCGRHNKSYLY